MADKSKFEWTDATWNPIRGCSRVSEGCRHCYAEGVAARFSGPGMPYEGLAKRVVVKSASAGKTTATPSPTEARWTGALTRAPRETLLQPLVWKRPRKIFVNSMSDLFHEGVPDEWIHEIFAVMALCPQHTFQILTKRPERMRNYLQAMENAYHGNVDSYMDRWAEPAMEIMADASAAQLIEDGGWPLPNVWLGTSIEDQATADTRIPHLMATPAAVRFLSAEPLLGPVDLDTAWHGESALDGECWGDCAWCSKGLPPMHNCQRGKGDWHKGRTGIDWVIVGGESGPKARPMHPDWARTLRDQCASASIPFFFKQWGEWVEYYDRDRDDPDWRRCPKTDGQYGRGATRYHNLAGGMGFHGERVIAVRNLGKATTGRQLDGIEHNAFPDSGK